MEFWCEKETLLQEIFGFHHIKASENQNESTFDEFLKAVVKFANSSNNFTDLLAACLFLKTDCKKVIFGEYGCSMIGFISFENSSEEITRLYLVCLDEWNFTIKSNIIDRQHTSNAHNFKLIFIAEISSSLYESFMASFYSLFRKAKALKGNERNTETSHQKTPSFILSVFQTTLERFLTI
jgi:hypothetical protein